MLGIDQKDQEIYSEGNDCTMLLQIGSRRISEKELVLEVNGIYAGLRLVEENCIDVDPLLPAHWNMFLRKSYGESGKVR